MECKAIVYSSNTGHTKQYAELLSEKIGLPCLPLQQARQELPRKMPVIYMGWLIAGFIKDYKKAKRKFDIQVVCAIGLGASGAQTVSVRKTNKIHEQTAVFTLQGGMEYKKLTGLYKSMIDTLIKVLSKKKQPTAEEQEMLVLLGKDDNYVSVENLEPIVQTISLSK